MRPKGNSPADNVRFTVCVLLYGDYPHLARRCLHSIWDSLAVGESSISEFRLGLNEISPATRSVVTWFIDQATGKLQLPVTRYECPKNACKYPLMRRMLRGNEPVATSHVMWFDDDSYLTDGPLWWKQVSAAASSAAMLGKLYYQRVIGQQWLWVKKQPWYNHRAGRCKINGSHIFRFCTGGWWVLRSDVLSRYDWPTRELRHRGGDALLGELLRHQDLWMQNFERGVRINADIHGRHSKSPRRGVDERQLGQRLSDLERPPCHDFECDVIATTSRR